MLVIFFAIFPFKHIFDYSVRKNLKSLKNVYREKKYRKKNTGRSEINWKNIYRKIGFPKNKK